MNYYGNFEFLEINDVVRCKNINSIKTTWKLWNVYINITLPNPSRAHSDFLPLVGYTMRRRKTGEKQKRTENKTSARWIKCWKIRTGLAVFHTAKWLCRSFLHFCFIWFELQQRTVTDIGNLVLVALELNTFHSILFFFFCWWSEF